jgi:hypothetical protein
MKGFVRVHNRVKVDEYFGDIASADRIGKRA